MRLAAILAPPGRDRRRPSIVVCAALVMMATSGVSIPTGVAAPARAATADCHPPGSRFVQIVVRHTGMALDIAGQSTDQGARATQWPVNGQANQQWRLEDAGDGYFRIVARHSCKVLDVKGQSMEQGAQVYQWEPNGQANQQWRLEDAGEGYVRIVVRHSGMVLDVAGQSTKQGANVTQWPSNGQANQQWRIEPLPSGSQIPSATCPAGSADAIGLSENDFKPAGGTTLTALQGGGFELHSDMTYWGGALSHVVSVPNYRLVGEARLVSGPGYGLGVRAWFDDAGRPTAKAFQYDPGASGYRDVNYPNDTGPTTSATTNDSWHCVTVTIEGLRYSMAIDANPIFSGVTDVTGDKLYLRVWNGTTADFRNLRIEPLSSPSLLLPYPPEQTWYVCRGYNVESHHGLDKYALDLITLDGPYGPQGCYGRDIAEQRAAEGRSVTAPAAGSVSLYQSEFVCITFDDKFSQGGSAFIGHLAPDSRVQGYVHAGDVIGRVGPYNAPETGEYAHIHIRFDRTKGCAGDGVPFADAYGTRFARAPDMPSDGSANQWQKEKLTR